MKIILLVKSIIKFKPHVQCALLYVILIQSRKWFLYSPIPMYLVNLLPSLTGDSNRR